MIPVITYFNNTITHRFPISLHTDLIERSVENISREIDIFWAPDKSEFVLREPLHFVWYRLESSDFSQGQFTIRLFNDTELTVKKAKIVLELEPYNVGLQRKLQK